MKKLIILLFGLLTCDAITAQIYPDPAPRRYYQERAERYYRNGRGDYFGLRLGLNVSTINSGDVDLDCNALAGLYFGGVYGIQLTYRAPVWLELGLAYSEKGGVNRNSGYRVKYRMCYIEMPIVMKFNIDINQFSIQPFLGGYLAWGAAGKIKDYQQRDTHATFDTFKVFDGGLRLGCGLEYQMLYLELGFDFGLANINRDNFDTAHNGCFFINAGVNF